MDHTGGTVQVSPSAGRLNGRSYSRKKPQKSQLKSECSHLSVSHLSGLTTGERQSMMFEP